MWVTHSAGHRSGAHIGECRDDPRRRPGRQREAAIHNIAAGNDLVWFHALRDGIWYSVEAGR
jgi:hypothetical protein